MAVVGIPDVRVVETVNIRLELTTIHVDVGDERNVIVQYTIYSTVARRASRLYFTLDLKVHQHTTPTVLFFVLKNKTTLLQAVTSKTLNLISQQP